MKQLLLRIARSPAGGFVLRAWLAAAPGLLPIRPIFRSERVIAFRHPVPAYPFHVLIVPLPPLAGLDELEDVHAPRLAGACDAARRIAAAENLPPGWKLVVNGGGFQDVRVLHFHLVVEAGSATGGSDRQGFLDRRNDRSVPIRLLLRDPWLIVEIQPGLLKQSPIPKPRRSGSRCLPLCAPGLDRGRQSSPWCVRASEAGEDMGCSKAEARRLGIASQRQSVVAWEIDGHGT